MLPETVHSGLVGRIALQAQDFSENLKELGLRSCLKA